jgi:multicomponent K+:H+ antiporter subunit G
MMELVFETAIAAIVVISGLFGLIGSYGLLKLTAPMQRLHAPTKASTVGVGAALLASAISAFWVSGQPGLQEVIVALFLFVTAPLSALYLAKAHLHLTVNPTDIPDTANGAAWGSQSTPLGDADVDAAHAKDAPKK